MPITHSRFARHTLGAAVMLLALLPAQVLAQSSPGRLRPPTDHACPRDHLTLFGGVVFAYTRTIGHTALSIHTDFQTTETVTLRHPGTDDPSRWFLIDRRPFTAGDWQRIEQRPGVLREGMRAAAWVCDDGRNATIEWAPPREP